MRYLFAILALPLFSQPTITGNPPIVQPAATHQFSASGGTGPYVWTLAAGSSGSISLTGLYTAASTIPVQQSQGGIALLAPDHAYNTDISSASTAALNATWMSYVTEMGNTQYLRFSFGFPAQYVTSSTPTTTLVTAYTTVADGLVPVPAAGTARIEGGWYTRDVLKIDHHFYWFDLTASEFGETYQYYTVGANPDCLLCNSQSTTGRTPMMTGKIPVLDNMGTPAPAATDAGGGYLWPLTLRVSEWQRAVENSTYVKHAARLTLKNFTQLGANLGPLWPGSNVAAGITCDGSHPNCVPYGAWARIKSSYMYPGSNPYCAAEVERGKRFGYLVLDGSPFPLEVNINLDEHAPAELLDCITEMGTYTTFATDALEFIDPSVYNIYDGTSPDEQDEPDAGLIKLGEDITPVAFAEVIVTDAMLATATKRILLQGCAIDFLKNQYVVQAGSNAIQLEWNQAACSPTGATFTLSSAVGSVTSAGVYTAPATLSGAVPTVITVVAEATADTDKKAYATIVVYPSDAPVRMLFSQQTNYDAGGGVVWTAGARNEEGVASLLDWQFFTPQARPYGDSSPVAPENDTNYPTTRGQGDLFGSMYTAPGNYLATLNMRSNPPPGGSLAPFPILIQTQGNIIYNDFVTSTYAGGDVTPFTLTVPFIVASDGLATLAIRSTFPGVANPGASGEALAGWIGSMSMEAYAGAPYIIIDPTHLATTVTPSQTHQFFCSAFFLAPGCTWAVTTGAGSIDADGLFTASATPPVGTAEVCVTATSTADVTKTATSCFDFEFGTMVMTPATATEINRGPVTTTAAVTINGVSYTNVEYTVRSGQGAIGLTSGIYTPPATLSSNMAVTIRATSTDDPTEYVEVTWTVMQTAIAVRLANGYFGGATYTNPDDSTVWTRTLAAAYTAVTGGPVVDYYQGGGTCTGATAGELPLYLGRVYMNDTPGEFSKTFTLPNSTYTVAMGFCGADMANTGSVITVTANGVAKFSNYALASPTVAYDQTFSVTVTDGTLELTWAAGTGAAYPLAVTVGYLSILETPSSGGSSTARRGMVGRGAVLR